MDLDMGATLGGVATGVGGIFGSLIGGAMNRKNVQETNKQNERLMREGWARDDNKHQRTVEDMRAAGLNPILAAGGGTSNSAPVTMQSSKPGEGLGQAVSNAGTLAISGYEADTRRKQQQWQEIANMIGIDESLARAENIRAQTGAVDSQVAKNIIDELIGRQLLTEKEYDFDIAKDKGMPSTMPLGPNGPVSWVLALTELLQNIRKDREAGTTGSFGLTDFIKSHQGKDSKTVSDQVRAPGPFGKDFSNQGTAKSQDVPKNIQQDPLKILRAIVGEPFPDPSIGAGMARRRRGGGKSATRPRNNLK